MARARTRARNPLVYAMGIDPGGTSGWSIIGVTRASMFGDAPRKIQYHEYGQVTGSYTNQVYTLGDIAMDHPGPLAIAMESFLPKKPVIDESYLSPLAVIYRFELLIDTGWVKLPVFYQSPSMAMETAPDNRLKSWGLYIPGPDHVKDGTRHAITFIRRAKTDRILREAAWG
jgi:hypothetical protein